MRLKLFINLALILSAILFCQRIQAQDNLQTNLSYRIEWLNKLAGLGNAAEAMDSIEAKGYLKLEGQDKGAVVIAIFEKKKDGNDHYAVISDSKGAIIGCGFSTSDENTYKQVMELIPQIGFKSTDKFPAGPGESAFVRQLTLLIVSPNPAKGEYLFTISRL